MMTAKKTLINVAKIQVLIEGNNSKTKWHQGYSMCPEEASNKLEKEYYDKARGCSVKAQEDNIFDYPDFLKQY